MLMKKSFLLLAGCLFAAAGVWADNPLTVNCGENVRITAYPATGYHFVKWAEDDNTDNPRDLSNVAADATFTAVFEINTYTITFKNWNDTILQTATYTHGDAVTAPVATKTADAQYTYTFDHWSPNVNYTAEANAEYTAVFTQTLNQYTISFVNWDDTPLQTSDWNYGETPAYNGADPTRTEAGKTYYFIGWDTEISPVTGAKTYKAVYDGVINTYAITPIAGDGGTVTGGGSAIQYGQSVTITATPNDCYEFVKWSDDNTEASRTFSVTGALTVTAEFRRITYKITVQTDDPAKGTVEAVKVTPAP